MTRLVVVLGFFACCHPAFGGSDGALPHFDYQAAQAHELAPHNRIVHVQGADGGSNQLHLTLTVSPSGDVLNAEPGSDSRLLKYWPELRETVLRWKFAPFTQNGHAIAAEVEEYLALMPPERLPKTHVEPPDVRKDSNVAITLQRSGCYGTCPAYSVSLTSAGTVSFEGHAYTIVSGKHRAAIHAGEVRSLAKRFIEDDFFSLEPRYFASVTDCPIYTLSVTIDGVNKKVEDYMGPWVGMPDVVRELENAVDEVSLSSRWINGSEGLVDVLRDEKYDFSSYEAQLLFKRAAQGGQLSTVREMIAAGMPLAPITGSGDRERRVPLDRNADFGMLSSGAAHEDVLAFLMHQGVGNNDVNDKNWALFLAALHGNLHSVQSLIAYGANPVAILRAAPDATSGTKRRGRLEGQTALIGAASSGSPEVVREILKYHPVLEAYDLRGQTAMFAAAGTDNADREEDRVVCIRLLAAAGANVNARDKEGRTPLHETFLTEVEKALMDLGAEVNARDNEGQTPLFTNVDEDAIPYLIAHGADPTIRDNEGKTAVEALQKNYPSRVAAIGKAMAERKVKELTSK